MSIATQTRVRLAPAVTLPGQVQEMAGELVAFLSHPARRAPDQYELVETRLLGLKAMARSIQEKFVGTTDELRMMQRAFRDQTDAVFSSSWFMRRARTWPEGHPGDYRTLEGIYGNEPYSEGVGAHLDRYFLSRSLAVAVRSRMRMLSRLLRERAAAEQDGGNWLNLGCGSCRELLALEDDSAKRTIHCVDLEAKAVDFARELLAGRRIGTLHLRVENALRYCRAERNRDRFGGFSTVYSAGLFDYLSDQTLSTLLGALYESLQEGGVLIAPVKDKNRYETFDYHWLSQWHFFLQRAEEDFWRIFASAGIPEHAVCMERDDTGVILFFLVTKSALPVPREEAPPAIRQAAPGPVWRLDAGTDEKTTHGESRVDS